MRSGNPSKRRPPGDTRGSPPEGGERILGAGDVAEGFPAERPSSREQIQVTGARVFRERTALAIGSFLLMVSALYVGHRLYRGMPVDLPKPRFFADADDRGLRGTGPLPTAAQQKYSPPPPLKTTVQVIEDPPGRNGLESFFAALRRTASGKPGAITRVCHWGDSQIVSDNITSTIRYRLQKRFGDAGHGFLMVGTPPSYLHSDVWHWSKGWSFAGVAQGYKRDHWYGVAGLHAMSSRYGAVSRYRTKESFRVGRHVSLFQVSYLEHPLGGRFRLEVDGEVRQTVNTRAAEKKEILLDIRVPDGVHSFSILGLGFGQNRLFGVAMERQGPGVVYDSLGLKGAQMHDLLRNDPAHWARQIAWRRPDLMVLGFGTNESYQEIPIRKYPPMWSKLIRRMRKARPGASCLVLAPVDRVHLRRFSHPRTAPLRDAMRKVALAEGCAFWDTFAAMGGDKAALHWRKAGLMWGDLAHLNPQGGKKLGGLLVQAIIEHYEAWLQRARYRERLRGSPHPSGDAGVVPGRPTPR